MERLKRGKNFGSQGTENSHEVTQSSTFMAQSLEFHQDPLLMSRNVQISTTKFQVMKNQMAQMTEKITANKPKMVEILKAKLRSMKNKLAQVQAQLLALKGTCIAKSYQHPKASTTSLPTGVKDIILQEVETSCLVGIVSTYVQAKRDPLHLELLWEPHLKVYKIPRVTPYNRMTSPLNHINRFLNQMESQTMHDEILCRAFLGTLEGVLYWWFFNLKLGSILNFGDLCWKFKAQHITKMRVKKGNTALFTITQGEDTLNE